MVAVGKITLLLREAEDGREGALDELMALVYAELERMARSYLRKHFGSRAEAITLEPAALVNESFLKLIQQRNRYDNHGHFFAIASRVMLRVLIDYRRQRAASIRGGGRTHIALVLDEQQIAGSERRTTGIDVERFADWKPSAPGERTWPRCASSGDSTSGRSPIPWTYRHPPSTGTGGLPRPGCPKQLALRVSKPRRSRHLPKMGLARGTPSGDNGAGFTNPAQTPIWAMGGP